jgi:hypothetical protein
MVKRIRHKRLGIVTVFITISMVIFSFYAGLHCLAAETEAELNQVSVVLPSEIPFSLVLPRNGGVGFVESDEFYITNNGAYGLEVTLNDAQVSLLDTESFSIAYNNLLPDNGNYLYPELICTQNGSASNYPLTASPQATHTYRLGSGESASFRISGTVSEREELAWSETTVTVSVCFAVNSDAPPEEEPAPVESEEEALDEISEQESGADAVEETELPASPDIDSDENAASENGAGEETELSSNTDIDFGESEDSENDAGEETELSSNTDIDFGESADSENGAGEETEQPPKTETDLSGEIDADAADSDAPTAQEPDQSSDEPPDEDAPIPPDGDMPTAT